MPHRSKLNVDGTLRDVDFIAHDPAEDADIYLVHGFGSPTFARVGTDSVSDNVYGWCTFNRMCAQSCEQPRHSGRAHLPSECRKMLFLLENHLGHTINYTEIPA